MSAVSASDKKKSRAKGPVFPMSSVTSAPGSGAGVVLPACGFSIREDTTDFHGTFRLHYDGTLLSTWVSAAASGGWEADLRRAVEEYDASHSVEKEPKTIVGEDDRGYLVNFIGYPETWTHPIDRKRVNHDIALPWVAAKVASSAVDGLTKEIAALRQENKALSERLDDLQQRQGFQEELDAKLRQQHEAFQKELDAKLQQQGEAFQKELDARLDQQHRQMEQDMRVIAGHLEDELKAGLKRSIKTSMLLDDALSKIAHFVEKQRAHMPSLGFASPTPKLVEDTLAAFDKLLVELDVSALIKKSEEADKAQQMVDILRSKVTAAAQLHTNLVSIHVAVGAVVEDIRCKWNPAFITGNEQNQRMTREQLSGLQPKFVAARKKARDWLKQTLETNNIMDLARRSGTGVDSQLKRWETDVLMPFKRWNTAAYAAQQAYKTKEGDEFNYERAISPHTPRQTGSDAEDTVKRYPVELELGVDRSHVDGVIREAVGKALNAKRSRDEKSGEDKKEDDGVGAEAAQQDDKRRKTVSPGQNVVDGTAEWE
jgi:hypothetical protein